MIRSCQKWFGVALMSCVSLSSCINNGSGNVGNTVSADFLATNNTKYRHTYSMIDSLGKTLQYFEDTVTVNVSVEENAIHGIEQSLKITARSTPYMMNGMAYPGTSTINWYTKENDSVCLIAYASPGPLYLPKGYAQPALPFDCDLSTPYSLKHYHITNTSLMDSMYLSDPKRLIYVLPLYPGKQWSGYSKEYWFKQLREIETVENVSTSAGIFSCFKIRTSINTAQFTPEAVWYDYISREGIILRTLEMTLNISTENNPEGIGRAKFYERLELIANN